MERTTFIVAVETVAVRRSGEGAMRMESKDFLLQQDGLGHTTITGMECGNLYFKGDEFARFMRFLGPLVEAYTAIGPINIESTSYPYLGVAKHYNVPYADVLAFLFVVETRDGRDFTENEAGWLDQWQFATLAAYKREQEARKTR
jgi:hypothetical protein